jgi:hypothetical protein
LRKLKGPKMNKEASALAFCFLLPISALSIIAAGACGTCLPLLLLVLFDLPICFFEKGIHSSFCIIWCTRSLLIVSNQTKVCDTKFMDHAWWIHKSTSETSKLGN